jgi:anhydro-N-acetylmuramic acid kinase
LNDERVAFDICPANIVLNKLSEIQGLQFDKNGDIARSGDINKDLLEELNNISFYKQSYPKSLGREWLNNAFLPVLGKYEITVEDKLRTCTEHISFQITKILNKYKRNSVLVTGGGTYNKFLIDLIKEKTQVKIVIPRPEIVEFKEALVFALLGVLRIRNEINCLSSVTGASNDSVCGKIAYFKNPV